MSARIIERSSVRAGVRRAPQVDWQQVVHTILVSRALDELEETQLLPARKVLYQFTARGHDVTQVLLGQLLSGARDGIGVYYRSRPLMLSVGLTLQDALASTMMRSGSVSDGRDIGVVFNLPNKEGVCVLPACGGVGAQYTPAIGWAQSLQYRSQVLREAEANGSIAVAHGGEASTATNGFWSALNIATTQRLPILFFIEDNGYGISVKSDFQTPGGNMVPGTWTAAGGQLCLSTGSAGECWPYSQPFQAGQQVSLTSSCNAASRWTALGTNQPQQQSAGERG